MCDLPDSSYFKKNKMQITKLFENHNAIASNEHSLFGKLL